MAKNTGITHFIRGGQIVLHHMRMFQQIAVRVLGVVLLAFVVMMTTWTWMKTTSYERYVVKTWLIAHVNGVLEPKAKQTFRQPDGEITTVYAKKIVQSPAIHAVIDRIQTIMIDGLGSGLLLFIVLAGGIILWLKHRGKQQTQDKRLKGDYLASPRAVKKAIQKNNAISDFYLSPHRIPIPTFSLKQHFLIHGTTGTGKSQVIRELLDHIRACGDKAFIYDKGCVLTEYYYDPKRDSLQNPLDDRTVTWDLWQECRDLAELESFAAAQIPRTSGAHDPFWVDAARTIFSQAANQMRKATSTPKLLPLLKYLLTAELEDIQHLLRGTVAESLMSEKIEKTAISIKSILATYLKSLCYVKEGDDPFSIRAWVEGKQDSQFLFVSSRGDKHATLKPLMTAWIDLAINTLLSLPDDDDRRIWFILDEFTSLHQLPQITEGLSEGRKFGGCFVIGMQNVAKLKQIYGANGADDISALLNTRCMFRQPDPTIAAWSAKNLGETEIAEVNESISYGANAIRDGVSISRTEKRKPVVTASEIMNLDNLTYYLRLAGSYPISRITMPYVSRPKHSPRFVPRTLAHDDLREDVEKLMADLKKTASTTKKPSQAPSSTSTEQSQQTVGTCLGSQYALDV